MQQQKQQRSPTVTSVPTRHALPSRTHLVGLDAVNHVFDVCEVTPAQREFLWQDGFITMDEFLQLEPDDVPGTLSSIIRRARRGAAATPASAEVQVPDFDWVLIKMLKALVYWCHERAQRGRELDAHAFTQDVMYDAMDMIGMEDNDDDGKWVDIYHGDFPMMGFVPTEWERWSGMLTRHLKWLPGHKNTPLVYVIRKEREFELPITSDRDRRIYRLPLHGRAFDGDNKRVFQILSSMLVNTVAWHIISRYSATEDGRGAMEALREHYDGPGEVTKRIRHAMQVVENSVFRSGDRFAFDEHVGRLAEAFDMMSDCGIPKTEKEKIRILLHSIHIQENVHMGVLEVNIHMRPELSSCFLMAADHIFQYFPFGTLTHTRKRRRGRRN